MSNLGKVCRKSVELRKKISRTFESKNFRTIDPSKNNWDQYFKKINKT